MGKFTVGDNVHAKFDSAAFGPQEFDGVVVEQTALGVIMEKFLNLPPAVTVQRPDGKVFEIGEDEATFLSSDAQPDNEIPDLTVRELREELLSRFNSLVRNFNANGEQFAKSVNDLAQRIEALEANQRERDEYRAHKEEEGEDYESRIGDAETIIGLCIVGIEKLEERVDVFSGELNIGHATTRTHDQIVTDADTAYDGERDALRAYLGEVCEFCGEPLSEHN